ncbi:maleylpyruvate isomerase N-terminal domain-containing protein [Ornithinimicrobium panacihumi]|uniref:maleylpyruvate isomerase N-terminal domain-containing protein n=1 Tax=Ornithinimicrobium panacihumi TaxID=2008449 RepID=UPI003F892A17
MTTTPRLTTDQLWDAADAQRRRTADLLASLGPRDWDRPSLCSGWNRQGRRGSPRLAP